MRRRIIYTLAVLFAAVQTFAQGTIKYEYDANNRLTKVTYGNGTTETFTYDKLGNRLTMKTVGNGSPVADIIDFADAKVKAICVANWDTDGDGELSKNEAAAVTDIGKIFSRNEEITSFDELEYFTGLTSIDDYAFQFCTSLTSVNIPNSVTSIGKNVFYYCGLTSVTIPNSVISIGEAAFDYCTRLKDVVIPNSVTSIGDRAFEGCMSLTTITIPNSVTNIGNGAFYECSWLSSITIGNSVTSLSVSTFSNCKSLSTIIVESGNTMYDSRDNCNAIIRSETDELIVGCKNTVIPNTVKGIGDEAFGTNSGLTSVTIPNSVISIGKYAFTACRDMTSIVIPSSVKTIGVSPFSSNIKSIVVESGNTTFDSRNNCNAIIRTETDELIVGCKTTVIPSNVKSIGEAAFAGLSGLTVTIPSSVSCIGDRAFSACFDLTSISIPNSVTTIGEEAFSYCSDLISITIPNSVKAIGDHAFMECKGLESVKSEILEPFNISSEVFAFMNWSDFNYVPLNATLYVPSGTKSLYEQAGGWGNFKEIKEFVEYESATYIVEDDKTVTMKDVLGSTEKEVEIPESVTINGNEYAVTAIAESAFENNTTMESIEIPESVTSIGNNAFVGCSNLTAIYCYAEDPVDLTGVVMARTRNGNVVSVASQVFAGVDKESCVLWVPVGCIDNYKAAEGWGDFANIVEMTRKGDVNGDKEVDIIDQSAIISHITGQTPRIFNKKAADMNGDKKVDAADIVELVNILKSAQ